MFARGQLPTEPDRRRVALPRRDRVLDHVLDCPGRGGHSRVRVSESKIHWVEGLALRVRSRHPTSSPGPSGQLDWGQRWHGRHHLVSNPRVDHAVEQIDQEVHRRQKDPVKEDDGEDHGLILDLHAGHEEFAHAGDIEHLLDEK